MLIDLVKQPEIKTLKAEVCIVGAGVAGITLARDLMQAGVKVLLLEAGGKDFEASSQALYEGRNTGMEYYDLDQARLRFFGGTTNIWGGRCVPLDPIDFKKRAWVPHSGWPISAEDLHPYYQKAQQTLGLGAYSYGSELWEEIDEKPPAFAEDSLTTRFWRFDNFRERFSWRRCTDLIESDKVTVVLHANAVHIQASEGAAAVRHIRVCTVSGNSLAVEARHYVLACGGIENARLLLASRDVESHGVGNSRDQVGRYFMEHPHARLGLIETSQAFKLWALFRKRFRSGQTDIAPALVASETLQERMQLLNSALTFKLQRDPEQGVPLNKRAYLSLKHSLSPTVSGRRLWHSYRNVRTFLQRHLRLPVERARARLGWTGLHVMTRAEQAPNPLSCVKLSPDRDRFGMQKVELDWQFTAQDKETIKRLGGILNTELNGLELGKLHISPWLNTDSLHWPVDATVSNHPIGGYHHIGTTRMGSDPATSVVQRDLAVHGYANLYVAGSSVFTTSGWANPTLTIVALSHRLAEHLGPKLDKNA